MRNLIFVFLVMCGVGFSQSVYAKRYSQKLCKQPGYKCVTVKGGQSWSSLFKNKEQREIVMRLNRMSTGLYGGLVIAVPKNLDSASLLSLAPFPSRMPAPGKNVLIIDPKVLAWGAYDKDGFLLRWGPTSMGKDYCADVNERCRTKSGKFAVYRQVGAECRSRKFPIPNGGAPMPYCSFFHGGFAVHAGELPGEHASHGCVRTYKEDARWLYQNFLKLETPVRVFEYET